MLVYNKRVFQVLFVSIWITMFFVVTGRVVHGETLSCGVSAELNINPDTNNSVSAVASGEWWDTCVPELQSYEIKGNDVTVYAVTPVDAICGFALTMWEDSLVVEGLAAEDYTFSLYLDNTFCTEANSTVLAGNAVPTAIGQVTVATDTTPPALLWVYGVCMVLFTGFVISRRVD